MSDKKDQRDALERVKFEVSQEMGISKKKESQENKKEIKNS
ncbi:MAG TPA: hypothetical protein VN426_16820 [Syntrophomonadaceae bacterium]|nr:hypothetical protein [Syntrophomonadaceae bacterium]